MQATYFTPCGYGSLVRCCTPLVHFYVQDGIIADAEQELSDAPVDVFSVASADQLPPYRRVSCVGRYHHDQAVFVGPRPLG